MTGHGGWLGRRERSGDWMIEQAVHVWDVLYWLKGELPVRAGGWGRTGLFSRVEPLPRRDRPLLGRAGVGRRLPGLVRAELDRPGRRRLHRHDTPRPRRGWRPRLLDRRADVPRSITPTADDPRRSAGRLPSGSGGVPRRGASRGTNAASADPIGRRPRGDCSSDCSPARRSMSAGSSPSMKCWMSSPDPMNAAWRTSRMRMTARPATDELRRNGRPTSWRKPPVARQPARHLLSLRSTAPAASRRQVGARVRQRPDVARLPGAAAHVVWPGKSGIGSKTDPSAGRLGRPSQPSSTDA